MSETVSRHEFNSLTEWLKEIDKSLEAHSKEEIKMEQRLEAVERDLKEIKAIVTELRDLWTQSKGAAKFLSLVVSLLAGGWALVLWFKDHIKI